MPRSEAFERLREDHRRVLEEIEILERAASGTRSRENPSEWPGPRVGAVLDTLAAQFETHMAAEDEVLYPRLLQALPWAKGAIEALLAEHCELRAMLATIQAALREPPDVSRNVSVAVQLNDFTELLRIHIRKEESVVFGVAEHALPPGELQALAARRIRDERPRFRSRERKE